MFRRISGRLRPCFGGSAADRQRRSGRGHRQQLDGRRQRSADHFGRSVTEGDVRVRDPRPQLPGLQQGVDPGFASGRTGLRDRLLPAGRAGPGVPQRATGATVATRPSPAFDAVHERRANFIYNGPNWVFTWNDESRSRAGSWSGCSGGTTQARANFFGDDFVVANAAVFNRCTSYRREELGGGAQPRLRSPSSFRDWPSTPAAAPRSARHDGPSHPIYRYPMSSSSPATTTVSSAAAMSNESKPTSTEQRTSSGRGVDAAQLLVLGDVEATVGQPGPGEDVGHRTVLHAHPRDPFTGLGVVPGDGVAECVDAVLSVHPDEGAEGRPVVAVDRPPHRAVLGIDARRLLLSEDQGDVTAAPPCVDGVGEGTTPEEAAVHDREADHPGARSRRHEGVADLDPAPAGARPVHRPVPPLVPARQVESHEPVVAHQVHGLAPEAHEVAGGGPAHVTVGPGQQRDVERAAPAPLAGEDGDVTVLPTGVANPISGRKYRHRTSPSVDTAASLATEASSSRGRYWTRTASSPSGASHTTRSPDSTGSIRQRSSPSEAPKPTRSPERSSAPITTPPNPRTAEAAKRVRHASSGSPSTAAGSSRRSRSGKISMPPAPATPGHRAGEHDDHQRQPGADRDHHGAAPTAPGSR